MSFKNILVPYNGSEGAKKGFKTALELASKTKGRISTITCLENQSIFAFLKLKKFEQDFEKEKELIKEELSHLKKDAEKLKISLEHVIVKSSFAANTISDYVKSNDIDTVILGQSPIVGTSGIYRESMANYLKSRIECALILIK